MTTRERKYEAKQEVPSSQEITPELLQKWLSPYNQSGFTQYETWLKTQTDPLAILNALKNAYPTFIKLPQLAKAIAAIGLHARQHGFRPSALDSTGAKFASWNDWLAWMEKTLVATTELPPPIANELLTGLAALSKNYYVIRPFEAEVINKLLAGLKTCRTLKEIRNGLKDLRALVDYLGVRNIAGLKVTTLSYLLSYMPQQKKEDKDTKTSVGKKSPLPIFIQTQIASHIAYIVRQINAASDDIQTIQLASLEKVLDQALRCPDTPPTTFSLLLLAAGRLLEQQEGNEKLKEQVSQILTLLNKDSTAAQMEIPNLAHAVYALVLPSPPGWLDLKPTENLVKHFLARVNKTPSPVDTSQQLTPLERESALREMAEYLCLTHQKLPPVIINLLQEKRPPIDNLSLQHQFYLYLQQQPWFNEHYEVINEEVLLNYAYIDFTIRNKKTGEEIGVEIDGIRHRNRAYDKRRDLHLLSLMDGQGEPILKGIFRLPVPKKPKGFWKPEEVSPLMARDLRSQLEKLDSTLPESSTPSSVLPSDSKSSGFEAKKLPPPDTTAEPSNPQTKRKKGKKKKPKKSSVQDLKKQLIAAIHSHNFKETNRLVEALTNSNAFKNDISGDQEKADIFLQAINTANNARKEDKENSNKIITCLIQRFGNRIVTTASAKGQSPLQHAITLDNKDILALFKKSYTENKNTPPIQNRVVLPKTTFLADDKDTSVLKQPAALCQNQQYNTGWLAQLERMAESGNMQAQYILATYHNLLSDSKPDGSEHKKEAVKWYRLAAEQGLSDAQFNLGVCYKNGIEVEKDVKEAIKWYRLAAEQGVSKAQFNLGVHFDKGEGVPKDSKTAVDWYQKAAEQGLPEAQFQLGVCFEEGDGVEKNPTEAVRLYRLAADQNNAPAQLNLGICYKRGRGVKKDLTEAVKWYRLAADQGIAEAQFNLGVCYDNEEDERDIEKNPKEAVRLYRLAADQGLPEAQFNLAICYQKGNDVPKDLKTAVDWYKKAAQQGFPRAQLQLGVCYDKGIGVEKNPTEAMRWYQLAAQQGLSDAQAKLESRAYDQKRSIPSVGALAPNLGSPLHQKPPTSPPSLQPGSGASPTSTSNQSRTQTHVSRGGS